MANMSSIRKIEDIIFDVKRRAFYVETLEDGTVILDETRPLPKLEFKSTVKLHGTFAGIRYRPGVNGGELTALSKAETLSTQKDNAGFAEFVQYNKDYFELYLGDYAKSLQMTEIQIMGEWVGRKIQKGVGINKIKNKTFVMFGIKFKTEDTENFQWAQIPAGFLGHLKDTEMNIRSIFEFPTWTTVMDFNNPKEGIQAFEDVCLEVEKRCPVADALLQEEASHGRSEAIEALEGNLIGEGIVSTAWWNDERYVFKTKGEEHSKVNKVKQPKEADPHQALKLEIAEKVTPGWRLNQSLVEALNGEPLQMKHIGQVVKWVIQDVQKEEQFILRENNFEFSDVKPFVNKIVVDWIKQKIREDATK